MGLPSFTDPVPDSGYRWWYVDAISDDGTHALTVIVFIGSVFSPYYAWARRAGQVPALQHCAVNAVLYGPVSRWAMTERDHRSVLAQADSLKIGNSGITIKPGHLNILINELTVPFPGKLEGELSIELPSYNFPAQSLDTPVAGPALHFWQPIAPQTRIRVGMNKPGLQWQGSAYVDSNFGAAPLEKSFQSWNWSRSHAPDGSTTVLYDVSERSGFYKERSLWFDQDGKWREISADVTHKLPDTRYWRIARRARTPRGVSVGELQTLEDTPFYSRSRFTENHPAHAQQSVHESLDLDRFDSGWVRCLLPFRMPRITKPRLCKSTRANSDA